MSLTIETFGESLSHFVRSIDIVDTSTKDDVLNLIAGYLEDEFGIKFFTMYMESSIDQKVGLIPTDWYRGGTGLLSPFKTIKAATEARFL